MNGLPVYNHAKDDLQAFRFITSNFIAQGLCRQVLDKLKLCECLEGLGMDDEQVRKALIAIAARAIFTSSEHRTAQLLARNSELAACYDHCEEITHKQLYTVTDQLFAHKEAIARFLYQRISDMFNLQDPLGHLRHQQHLLRGCKSRQPAVSTQAQQGKAQ